MLQERLRSLSNVDITTNARTTEVLGDDHVTGIQYEDMSTNEIKINFRWYLCSNWISSNTAWLGNAVELNERKL